MIDRKVRLGAHILQLLWIADIADQRFRRIQGGQLVFGRDEVTAGISVIIPHQRVLVSDVQAAVVDLVHGQIAEPVIVSLSGVIAIQVIVVARIHMMREVFVFLVIHASGIVQVRFRAVCVIRKIEAVVDPAAVGALESFHVHVQRAGRMTFDVAFPQVQQE